MFIVQSYPLAIAFCFITMLCWGSWGNTQKLAARTWRYELFYWDYVIGLLLFSVLSAFTLGSFGTEGRSFLADLAQADAGNLFSAFMGGVIFNASNILLSAAIALCGMSVAFPVGVGLALVLGVVINYFSAAKGDPTFIFLGVLLIAAAIVMNGFAYKKAQTEKRKLTTKGILISVAAGIIMAFFYRFVAASMDLNDFAAPTAGKMTPYTAVFIFAVGVFISNFLFNTVAMKRPVDGEPVRIADYFKGGLKTHMVGVLGGMTSGAPLVLQVAIKPTPSIGQSQPSVNLQTMEPETLTIHGRHDPCIVPRAVPVVEAAVAFGLMDLLIQG
jgi:glucose uptake protein